MTPREISSVISLAPHWAQASMGGNQMPDHYLTLFSSFSVGREEVFRFYESYMSLDKAIRDTFNEQTARGH